MAHLDLLLLAVALALALAYALWLGRLLAQLDRKLELLEHHCRLCRREVAAQLAGRLTHQPSGAFWEGLPSPTPSWAPGTGADERSP